MNKSTREFVFRLFILPQHVSDALCCLQEVKRQKHMLKKNK